MKNFGKVTLALGLLLSGPYIFADAGASSPEFLRLEMFGGYVPRDRTGWRSGISILADGSVTHFSRSSANAPEEQVALASLSKETMTVLQEDLDSMPETEEIVFDNSLPCMDAPSTRYIAPMKSDKIFAKTVQCRRGILKGFPRGRRVTSILNSLKSIAIEVKSPADTFNPEIL